MGVGRLEVSFFGVLYSGETLDWFSHSSLGIISFIFSLEGVNMGISFSFFLRSTSSPSVLALSLYYF